MEINMDIQQEYLGGYQNDKGSLRKHKYTSTSTDKDLDGLQFFSETFTKKKSFMDWGKSETHYYLEENKKMFKSIPKLVEFVKKEKIKVMKKPQPNGVQEYRDKRNDHRYRVTHSGRTTTIPSEGYKNRQDMIDAAVNGAIAILEEWRDRITPEQKERLLKILGE